MLLSETFQYEEVTGFKFGYKLFGRPKMIAHIYFVDGLLIDTGQSKVRKKVLSKTRELDIEQIFITHHHEDHSGNIPAIREQHNCRVFGSVACSRMMKNPPALSFAQKLTWGSRGPYHHIVELEGQLKTKQYSFEIIPIPGHASDMVALYEPDRQWLFSADLFINTYIGYFIENESVADQIESTKKVLQLDFKVMFCGHNPQFENPKQPLTKKLEFLESSFEKSLVCTAKDTRPMRSSGN